MSLSLAKMVAYFASINWAGIGAFIVKYWYAFVIAALLASTALEAHNLDHVKSQLKTEKAAHAADIKSYKDAQAAAETKAAQMKASLQKQNEDQANAADQNYGNLLSQYRANLLRYKAAQSVPSQSGFGKQDGAAQGVDRSGYSTRVPPGELSISNEDANICAVNTARLQAAHDWAEEVVKTDESK